MSADGSWRDERIGWPTRALIFFSLFGLFGGDFFLFLFSTVGSWLPVITLVLAIPLLVVFLVAVFRRRWKAVAILAATWALMVLHYVDAFQSGIALYWLRGQGFRVHTMLHKDYLSRCDLTHFVENGVEQAVGPCQGFDWGDYFTTIIYDTSGEFMLPAAQRTAAWKQALAGVISAEVLSKDDRASHLYGNFYSVDYLPNES